MSAVAFVTCCCTSSFESHTAVNLPGVIGVLRGLNPYYSADWAIRGSNSFYSVDWARLNLVRDISLIEVLTDEVSSTRNSS
jgi:hypothetical protein